MLRLMLAALITCLVAVVSAADNKRATARDSADMTTQLLRDKENLRPVAHAATLIEKLDGKFFDWRTARGPQRDLGCFAKDDLAALVPELFEWEVPGEVATGIRIDRVVVLLVEAVKQMWEDLEWLHEKVEQLANSLSRVEAEVSDHRTRLGQHDHRLASHDMLLAGLQTKVIEQGKKLAVLEEKTQLLEAKNQELEQKVSELTAAVAAIQAAMGGGN